MKAYDSTLVINVLCADYPDIASRINQKIQTAMPELILNDLSELETIIDRFCKLKGLEYDTWSNQPGQTRITNDRELLLALIIMFFQPEKINGLHYGRIKQGIVKNLSIHMNCSKEIISQSISCALDNYRIYADFKEEVDQLYETLKSKYHGNSNS